MKNNKVNLVCERVKFYSSYDKDAFFEWLQKIEAITNFKGVRDTIVLFIANQKISDESLQNIIALFRRYNIERKQLEVFLNKDNKELFESYKNGYSVCVYPAKQ